MQARMLFAATAVMFALVACGRVPVSVPGLPERKPNTMTITITAEEGANGGQPTPVDLVFAKGELVDQLDGLSARDWFLRRSRVAEQYGDEVFIRDYVLNPGSATSAAFEERKDAEAVFVFAGYGSEGAHSYRLNRGKAYVVQLGLDAFTAESRK